MVSTTAKLARGIHLVVFVLHKIIEHTDGYREEFEIYWRDCVLGLLVYPSSLWRIFRLVGIAVGTPANESMERQTGAQVFFLAVLARTSSFFEPENLFPTL